MDDSELAEIVASGSSARGQCGRHRRRRDRRRSVHWYEHYDAKNSRAVADHRSGRRPDPAADAGRRRSAADARAAARKTSGRGPADSWDDRSLYDRCITRGVPGSMMPAIYGNAYEIMQAPGFVAIRYEMIHETRVIPLDGRPHAGEEHHARTWATRAAAGKATRWSSRRPTSTSAARYPQRQPPRRCTLIERFTPVGAEQGRVVGDDRRSGDVDQAVDVRDAPDAGTPTQPLFEYACHEGNYGLRNILSAARAEEKAAKEKGQVMRASAAIDCLWSRDRSRGDARSSRITRSPCSTRRSA